MVTTLTIPSNSSSFALDECTKRHNAEGRTGKIFPSVECGRCRAKARSVYPHNLERHLYNGLSSIGEVGRLDNNKKQPKNRGYANTTDPQIPQPDLRFSQKTLRSKRQAPQNNTKLFARAQTKLSQIDLSWDAVACPLHQWSTTCQ